MKKMSKRLVALLLAAVMVMGLSITTFASTNTTHQVTIYLQRATRNSNGAVISRSSLNSGQPVVVTVNNGQTYKDAIEKACYEETTAITNAAWTSSGEYLKSLKVGGSTLTNYDTFPNDHTYVGLSWMYYNDDLSTIPASIDDYPSTPLSSAVINTDVIFTLSFESMTYTW